MSSESDVIKEFLVSVGVKVDNQTLAKFGGIIEMIGTRVLAVATALATAATAIEVFVTKVSEKMEDLYWSSQRLRSSVAAIKDYTLSIRNLGGTAEGASSSLENLAQLIRTNPGYAALIRNLGVNPNQGTVGIANALGEQFKKMPYFIAARYAAALGIDESTLWAMVHAPRGGALGGAAGPNSALYKAAGINADVAAKRMHEYMVQVRALENEYSGLAVILASALLPVAEKLLYWMRDIAQQIAKAVGSIKPEEWKEWSDTLKTLATNTGEFARNIGELFKTLYGLYSTLNKMVGSRSPLQDLNDLIKSTALWTRSLSLDLKALNDVMTGNWGAAWEDFKASSAAERAAFANDTGAKPRPKPGPSGPGVFDKIGKGASDIGGAVWKGVVDFFKTKGWTEAQAAGIAANLYGENAGLDPHLKGDGGAAIGIAQWHADRQRDFLKFAGHDLAHSTRDEQLAFVQWELTHTQKRAGDLLHAARTAAEAGAIVSRFYERPRAASRDAAHRAGLANRIVTMNQKTDIHLGSGAGGIGAAGIGRDVANQQGRVNADLLRNLKGVVQ